MKLRELVTRLQELQKSWTDDTGVYIDFDASYIFEVEEIVEDGAADGILLCTHPFGVKGLQGGLVR